MMISFEGIAPVFAQTIHHKMYAMLLASAAFTAPPMSLTAMVPATEVRTTTPLAAVDALAAGALAAGGAIAGALFLGRPANEPSSPANQREQKLAALKAEGKRTITRREAIAGSKVGMVGKVAPAVFDEVAPVQEWVGAVVPALAAPVPEAPTDSGSDAVLSRAPGRVARGRVVRVATSVAPSGWVEGRAEKSAEARAARRAAMKAMNSQGGA